MHTPMVSPWPAPQRVPDVEVQVQEDCWETTKDTPTNLTTPTPVVKLEPFRRASILFAKRIVISHTITDGEVAPVSYRHS